MAYMSQEMKNKLAPAIKSILKKYAVKGSIGVINSSTLVVKIKSGEIDFISAENARRKALSERTGDDFYECKGSYDPNPYRQYGNSEEKTKIDEFFNELIAAMKGSEWFDNSDSMTDYYDVAYYTRISVGQSDKPYNYESN
jgi:hypothetical protein